jgi:hypothetical protein
VMISGLGRRDSSKKLGDRRGKRAQLMVRHLRVV